jgi:mono/diheme cytochrome c family protein
MLRNIIGGVVGLGVIGLGVFWVVTMPKTVAASAIAAHTPDLKNGEELFNAGGCVSCHQTPKQDDRTILGGGVELKSPFGMFVGPNISSDQTDGIGAWTDAQFVTAMQKGVAPNGDHLFPSFPYTSFQKMPLSDLLDLHAYLKTLPAVQGKAPEHRLSFPFNVRRLVGGWKFLYLDGKPFVADDKQSAEWNRGAYLVNGPGHCAECHSSRDAMGGIIPSTRFAGGADVEGEGWVPNITQQGLKDWTADDIAYMLEIGSTPSGDSVGGTMTEVITNMSFLTAEDRQAMAVYLKSLPAIPDPPRPAKKEEPAAESAAP